MKKYICFIALCLTAICVVAQESNVLKKVQLKSGISVTGYVTNNTDGSIIVRTSDGDQLFYQSSEIKSVDLLDKPEKQKIKDENSMKEKGFQISVEGCVGSGYNGGNMKQLFVAPSYRVNKKLLFGIGVGLIDGITWSVYNSGFDIYTSQFAKAIVRYNILDKRVTPYVGLDAGALDSSLLLGAEIGFMFRSRRGSGLHLAFLSEYLIDFDDNYICGKIGWTF